MESGSLRWFLGGIVAGAVFMGACGPDSFRALAEIVWEPRPSSFYLRDRNGNLVFESPRPDLCGGDESEVIGYNPDLESCVRIAASAGGYYESTDCTGTAYEYRGATIFLSGRQARPTAPVRYLAMGPDNTAREIIYGTTVLERTFRSSRLGIAGACTELDAPWTTDAVTVSIVSPAGLPFEYPFTAPPVWTAEP